MVVQELLFVLAGVAAVTAVTGGDGFAWSTAATHYTGLPMHTNQDCEIAVSKNRLSFSARGMERITIESRRVLGASYLDNAAICYPARAMMDKGGPALRLAALPTAVTAKAKKGYTVITYRELNGIPSYIIVNYSQVLSEKVNAMACAPFTA